MRPTTSASNLYRRAACPGSAKMEENLPEEETKEAREGKLLHDYDAHENYDRRMLTPAQRDLLRINERCLQTILDVIGLPLE